MTGFTFPMGTSLLNRGRDLVELPNGWGTVPVGTETTYLLGRDGAVLVAAVGASLPLFSAKADSSAPEE